MISLNTPPLNLGLKIQSHPVMQVLSNLQKYYLAVNGNYCWSAIHLQFWSSELTGFYSSFPLWTHKIKKLLPRNPEEWILTSDAPFSIPAHITPAEPTLINLLYNKTTIFLLWSWVWNYYFTTYKMLENINIFLFKLFFSFVYLEVSVMPCA